MFTETSQTSTAKARNPVPDKLLSEREDGAITLLSIAKVTRALVGVELASIGLHQGQDELLMALGSDVPAAVSALADRLCVRPSTVSKMLDRLAAKDLVERVPSDGDARITLVRATPKGAAMRRDIVQVWSRLQACVDGKLKDRESEDRMRHLQSVETALKTKLARLR